MSLNFNYFTCIVSDKTKNPNKVLVFYQNTYFIVFINMWTLILKILFYHMALIEVCMYVCASGCKM